MENRKSGIQQTEVLAGNLEHACDWNSQAQKNHYLMQQIADFMRRLYEYFHLEKQGIEKVQKIYLLISLKVLAN